MLVLLFLKKFYFRLCWVVVCRLLTVVASLAVEHGLSVHGLPELRLAGSVVMVRVLSRPGACGIFPDPGSNPRPLHWQVDS